MYFKTVKNLAELRTEYKKLVKELHPDNLKTGSEKAFKEMVAEYEKMFEILKNAATEDQSKDFDLNIDKAIREMIEKIVNMNITIEIVGTWIWCTGNTYQYKDDLKTLGFRWCPSKKAWSWHTGEFIRFSKRKNSYQDIKNKYGYTTIKEEDQTKKEYKKLN